MYITLITHMLLKLTEYPYMIYISFGFHVLNSIGPLLYLFDSVDSTHFEITLQNLFVAITLVSILVSYVGCFVCRKTVNGQADFILYYLIITISIIMKIVIYVKQHDGKNHDVDYNVNILGVSMEVLELLVDVLLSKWLLAKLNKGIEEQTLA